MLGRFLTFACLALACLPSGNVQCIPKPDSAEQEVFSSVKNLQVLGVNVSPAGIELPLEERRDRVIATFRDYAGSSNPIETTKLQGTLGESGGECKVSLFGRNRHGKMEIRGTIGIADFRGTVIRQVGKDMFSQKVALRRKPAESDVRIGMLSDGAISTGSDLVGGVTTSYASGKPPLTKP
jgi:hypothetical protein